MNLQHERIALLCEALNLNDIPNTYAEMAQTAAKQETTYVDYLQNLLPAEFNAKQTRQRSHLSAISRFSSVKSIGPL